MKWRHYVLFYLLVLIAFFRTVPGGWRFYTQHIYPVIGSILSPISGWFPFAVGDIFIACSIAWCILYLNKRSKAAFGRVLEYLLWVYAWFYLAWGLNYSQPNLFKRIYMTPAEVSEVKFKAFAYRYADSLNFYSEERRMKSEESISYDSLKDKVKDAVLSGYQHIGRSEGINEPFNNAPHAKTMVFSWLSSMAGVTGSMGPFFCEFTLNSDIRPHDYPATYAHEYAHFLGIANEGEANFYSYLVCTASPDKDVKFSGYYHIFFHVLNNVYQILGKKEGDAYLKHIRPEVIQLAKSDQKYWMDKRCKVLDEAQDFIFDLYLKGNHVEEGRKSYSGVIALILSWEEYTN